jgi:agmatinase
MTNIFGLSFTEEDARLIILPVPWEVTVSYGSGTARAADRILQASVQVDLYDAAGAGMYMRPVDNQLLMRSDYLRKEAQRYLQTGDLQALLSLRVAYTQFTYSHASAIYNALQECNQLERVVQVGIRDFSPEEWKFIEKSRGRVIPFPDPALRERRFKGETWEAISNGIVDTLPPKVFLSFDVDGLDPKLCPGTGTPVPGGLDWEEVHYLCHKVLDSGRTLIGFDLMEVGPGEWDANVGARLLWKLGNLLIRSNS